MDYDLLIIGGGINGTAIARAAAVAGHRLLLVEQGDLAQGTSSASTKLMHGGLRYLEQYEFALVHESLVERDIMLKTAPHLVQPLEFRIPHNRAMRPWPIMRAGLLLYDLLAWRGKLPRSRSIRINDPALKNDGIRGFSYWDAKVDDARLTVLNALDAAEMGATILTRTRFASATRQDDGWQVVLENGTGQKNLKCRMIVNAGGPGVENILRDGFARETSHSRLRLVRGSHIIVPRCFEGDHAWLFQQADGRIVFAIPYHRDHMLIGTTDTPVSDPADSHISEEEIDYLLAAINHYRRESLTREEVVDSYSGIRALFDDGASTASAVSRDYHLDLDIAGPPLLSIFGGKITTARHLAEDVLKRLGIRDGDTRHRPLPGGSFSDFTQLFDMAHNLWPFIEPHILERMAYAYGTRIASIMGEARSLGDMGRHFGAGLYEREVEYLLSHEWAASAEDILWRRSKLGLRLNSTQAQALETWISESTK